MISPSVRRFLSLPFVVGLLLGVGSTTIAATLRGSSIFTDVPPGAFYDQAVGEMYTAGIIKGYDASHFGPDDYVTRGQMAVLMKRLRDELKGTVSTASSSRSSSSSSSSVSTTPQGAFRFSIEKLSIIKTASKVSLSIIRTGGSQGTVTVHYATGSGTATPGKDYEPTSGTLTFLDKETVKIIDVRLINNTIAGGNKTFPIILSSPGGGATLSTPSITTVTILDNQAGGASSSSVSSTAGAGTFGFNAVGYGIGENRGSITITVNRTGGTKGAVSVNYATSGGTAAPGSNYTSTSGTLSFADGESSKTFIVPVIDNTTIDGNKTVNLVLSTPTGGATVGPQGTAVLTIVDNEVTTTSTGGTLRDRKSVV